MVAEMLVGDLVERLRPDVELVNPEKDRDEQQREQGHGAHGGAENAANDHAPTTSGEVADHEDSHGAEGDAQPAHESEQVGAEELLGAQECEDDRDDAEDDADDQRALRNGFHHWRRVQIEMFHRRRAHFFSSVVELFSGKSAGKVAPVPGSRNFNGSEGIFWPGGTSAMVAFWLNCSART